MAELEEPGWPNLRSGPPAGALFTNAFFAAMQTNRQRQALEERIHEANLRMSISEAEHERKIEAMNINAALSVNRLNLARENAETRAYYEGLRTDIARGRADDLHMKMNQMYGDNQEASELNKAIREIDSTPGTSAHAAKLNKVGLDFYNVIANNKRAEAIFKDAELRQEKARGALDTQAAALQRNITNLTKTSEVKQAHYNIDDEYFAHGKDKKNPTRFVGFDAQGNPIKPDDKGNIVGAKTWATTAAGTYDTVRDLMKTRSELLSGGAETLPAHKSPQENSGFVVGKTYVDKNGNKAVFNQDGSWTPQ